MRTINREEIVARVGRVAVLYGGTSAEREISLQSGQAVFDSLQRSGIESSLIDVDADIVDRLREVDADLVINMLHGKSGEDGEIQGLLEIMKLPYTGSGVLASALAMDKVRSKLLWQSLGLSTAPFVELDAGTYWEGVIGKLGRVVVKPVSGGSSLGISICETAAELEKQFATAHDYDTRVMAERHVAGKEYSTGVLSEQILPTIELETEREFFDYEAKYIDSATRIICPARLEAQELTELESLVERAYKALGCAGLARIDVMRDEAGTFYLLEANTIPGMTSHSFVPTALARVGVNFDELILHIIDDRLRVQ